MGCGNDQCCTSFSRLPERKWRRCYAQIVNIDPSFHHGSCRCFADDFTRLSRISCQNAFIAYHFGKTSGEFQYIVKRKILIENSTYTGDRDFHNAICKALLLNIQNAPLRAIALM
jgi:hypothetical protein